MRASDRNSDARKSESAFERETRGARAETREFFPMARGTAKHVIRSAMRPPSAAAVVGNETRLPSEKSRERGDPRVFAINSRSTSNRKVYLTDSLARPLTCSQARSCARLRGINGFATCDAASTRECFGLTKLIKTHIRTSQLTSWLAGWLASWLVSWLSNWLAGWFAMYHVPSNGAVVCAPRQPCN